MGRGYVQIAEYYPRLKNPDKYVGTRPITLRSSWEIMFVRRFLDGSPEVTAWAAESITIPYKYKIDGKQHRYFVDFWFRHKDGRQFLIEIKPKSQCLPPKQQQRKTQSYLRQLAEYEKNQNKWEAAERFCEKQRAKGKPLEFKVVTEKELGISG